MNEQQNEIQSGRQDTLTPEGTGGAGRMFTQEEVNRIVSERLAREREKLTQQATIDQREQALLQREQAFEAKQARAAKEAAVREYYKSKQIEGRALEVAMRGSGAEIEALELDGDGKIKDYSAIDDLIADVFAGLVRKTTTIGAHTPMPPIFEGPSEQDRIAQAFKPKI